MASRRVQCCHIGGFHVADDLHAVLVKMLEKTCQLKGRTVDLLALQHDSVCVNLGGHIAESLFFNQLRNGNISHWYLPLCHENMRIPFPLLPDSWREPRRVPPPKRFSPPQSCGMRA